MAKVYNLASRRPSRLKIDYAADLNDEQRAVVEAGDGPKLVIAGAGTGKTRALTYRVARLLDRGVPAARILLLTFTNKAAKEMLRRVENLAGPEAEQVWGGTFHHIANILLRDHCEALGYQQNYNIIDHEDALEVMNAAVAKCGIKTRERRFPKAKVLINIVSSAINTQRSIAEVVQRKAPNFISETEAIVVVARAYVEQKLAMNLMDFDDLLVNWWVALQELPEVAQLWQQQFDHILVDEYQDTNSLQGQIIDAMAALKRNVTVVGDDAQSIYGFRGADVENILRFPERYPDSEQYQLTINYRSTPGILTLANASISQNRRGFHKDLRAIRPPVSRPALVSCEDVYQQAEFVAQRILDLRDEGVDLEQVAVLYRAHHHAMEIQVELSRRGIPYRVRSGLRFFEQAHIKDVLSYLRFIYNPLDELSFRRAVKLHEGIGNSGAAKLFAQGQQVFASGQQILSEQVLLSLGQKLNVRAQRGFAGFAKLVASMAHPRAGLGPGAMIGLIAESSYRDVIYQQYSNASQRIDDIDQLADYASAFADLDSFLNELALVSSFGSEDVLGVDEEDERVTLSSVHQAKGLEWGRVFVVWLADGRFPIDMALREAEGEEEERRLFYVATTRAKDELYLTFPMTYQGRDRRKILLSRSRFLAELPQNLKNEDDENADDEDALYESWLLQVVQDDAPALDDAKVLSLPLDDDDVDAS